MIPSVSLHLLTQDNSIPGNRKDGFRFHYLLFVIILTPIYLWFELSFGVTLLDAMSSNVVIDDTKNIEHWGRMISGAAVALLLLSGWISHWEREVMPWTKGLLGCLGIVLVSMVATWWAQGQLLEFYVQRTSEELPWAVGSLVFLLLSAFFMLRLWLRKVAVDSRARYLWLGLVVLLVLVVGYAQVVLIKQVNPDRERQLGIERQQTATFSIIRRGLQEGIYQLPNVDLPASALRSPEGKTYLSLFPIFGVMYDQDAMVAERPRLLAEFMYHDWMRDFGDQAYAGYRSVTDSIESFYDNTYKASNEPVKVGDRMVPPHLSRSQFFAHEAVKREIRQQLACFDCNYLVGMDKDSFGREFYKNSKANDVAEAVKTFADPEKFENGRTGDRAARTYWAPILALLFSMLGAFTHVFKLLVTLTAYFQRKTFSNIDAADSMIANQVIVNSSRVTAGAVIALALFAYFYENQLTGNTSYIEQRAKLWQERPVVGAIAAHWTVNTQSLAYPFTKKLRPEWLEFGTDPIKMIPVVRDWFANEEYE